MQTTFFKYGLVHSAIINGCFSLILFSGADCNAADLPKDDDVALKLDSPDRKKDRKSPRDQPSSLHCSPQLFNNPGTPEITNESSVTHCERHSVCGEVPAKIARIHVYNELTKIGDNDGLVQEEAPNTLEVPKQLSDPDGPMDKEAAPQNSFTRNE